MAAQTGTSASTSLPAPTLKTESALKTPELPRAHVALILPMALPSLARLAEALHAGYAAGANVDQGLAVPFSLYPVENEGSALVAASKDALARGAVMVVGGLTRDGASMLATQARWGVPVLALNQPAETRNLPEEFFHVSLSAEHEARLAAQQAFVDGVRTGIVVATPSPLSQRVADAFEREWIRVGGALAKRLSFNGTAGDAGRLKGRVEEGAADFAFYALDAQQARVARPYLPPISVAYGTSQITDLRADSISNTDLSGTRFMEMPWFVQPDHPAVAIYARPKPGLGMEHERLYALGIDAYRLSVGLLRPPTRRPRQVDGVTGRLELADRHAFSRQPVPVEYVEGRLVLRFRE